MRELFVWYRVEMRRTDAARAAVDAMQSALVAAVPELQARLLIRRDAGVQTWMETYALPVASAAPRDGVDAGIEAAIATAALALRGVIDGERHVEAFDVVR